MEKCLDCGKEFVNKAGWACHRVYCREELDKAGMVSDAIKQGGLLCEMGCGRPARFVLKMGKICCEVDSKSCPEMRRKNSESHKGICPKWKNGHPKGMAGKITIWRGKTYDEIYGKEKSVKIKHKLSVSHIGHSGMASTEDKEQQRRKNLSVSMKAGGKSGGYRRKSGRGKHGWYKGIWCDSSWELAWVMYHLDHGIPFERNKTSLSMSGRVKYIGICQILRCRMERMWRLRRGWMIRGERNWRHVREFMC
ncbi:MAG: hypothetical protein WCH76_06985 [Candidatus Riflemargulisbacteria bacterium]